MSENKRPEWIAEAANEILEIEAVIGCDTRTLEFTARCERIAQIIDLRLREQIARVAKEAAPALREELEKVGRLCPLTS